MIIGTAGHIDHGKTALVKALTGVECDRLKEEKTRGITIDLGFAYLPAPSGDILGFIDVPGHQRLVHTMLAGASGIDFAMLVVAANEGIKPQTREHLAIINLLGVSRGIVVITKSDLVDAGELSRIVREVRAVIADTVLDGVDIVPVSALTGDGIGALREQLFSAAAFVREHRSDGRFRLAVDRAFTLAGIGVVVTGTVLSGSVRVGEHVKLSPSGIDARVRSIHAQNRESNIARQGDRCALNLAGAGVTKDAIHRGDVVLDPYLHAPTARIDAVLQVLPGEEKAIGQWFPVRLHHAAAETGAHIALFEDAPIAPGSARAVQLVLDEPLAAAVPDRFIVRDVSAQRTIGGGQFIDLRPPARKRRTAERQLQRRALAIGDAATALAGLLDAPPYAVNLSSFARDRALSQGEMEGLIVNLRLVTLAADHDLTVLSAERWKSLVQSVLERLAAFHSENPDSQGIGREHLRLAVMPRLPPTTFLTALQSMVRSGSIALDGAFVRLSSHRVHLSAVDESFWHGIAALLSGDVRFRPPRVREIATLLGRDERDVRRVLKLAAKLGWVDEIAHDHFFLRSTVSEMVATIAELSARANCPHFAAGDFRDRFANGRKVAIQILEFFDRHGVTIRKGDLRTANRHRLDLFSAAGPETENSSGGETSPVGRSGFKSEWGSEPVPGGFDSHPPPPPSRKPIV